MARAGDERLVSSLEALSNASRLALLRQLLRPRILTELRLGPPGAEETDERSIARQAVRAHLRRLIEAGVVMVDEVERDFGRTKSYMLNHARLFAIAEDLRDLAKLRPLQEGRPLPTLADARPATRPADFPRLLVVRGLSEGTAFVLRAPRDATPAEWLIGRRRGLTVSLDYDPFVSLENTRVSWRDSSFLVEDLPSSKNGTSLNFERLERGLATPLSHGDVVGVGRTHFVFQAEPAMKGR